MNEVTRVLDELREMYEGHPPLSKHQIPRGVKTLEERVEFELNGALHTDDPEHKLNYYHRAVYSMLQVIAVMEDKLEPEQYSTDPEINEFFEQDAAQIDKGSSTPKTERRQLKYAEEVPQINEHTQATDELMRELDRASPMPQSKNARRGR